MSDFFEIDPFYGIRTDWKWNENEQSYTLNRTSDVEPVLDYTKAMANELGKDKQGIKEGWHLYAKLPAIVMLQMRAKGIDVTLPEHQQRMLQEINQNYTDLRTTTGWEGKRAGRKIFYG